MNLKLPILKNAIATLISWAGEIRRVVFVVENEEVWESCDIDVVFPTGRTAFNVVKSQICKRKTSREISIQAKFFIEIPGGSPTYVDVKLPFTPSKVDTHVVPVAINDVTGGANYVGIGVMPIETDSDILRIRLFDEAAFTNGNTYCFKLRGDLTIN